MIKKPLFHKHTLGERKDKLHAGGSLCKPRLTRDWCTESESSPKAKLENNNPTKMDKVRLEEIKEKARRCVPIRQRTREDTKCWRPPWCITAVSVRSMATQRQSWKFLNTTTHSKKHKLKTYNHPTPLRPNNCKALDTFPRGMKLTHPQCAQIFTLSRTVLWFLNLMLPPLDRESPWKYTPWWVYEGVSRKVYLIWDKPPLVWVALSQDMLVSWTE